MKKQFIYAGSLSAMMLALTLGGCTSSQPAATTATIPTTLEVKQEEKNPLLKEWTGPYGGVPAFDNMNLANLKPAMEKGMAMHLAEIEMIAQNPQPATFENTIAAMEKAGEPLNRVFTYYSIWGSNLSTPEFRKIQSELAPQISEYSSKITQNQKLFQRIKTVYEASKQNPLPAEEQRLTQLIYENFAMEGAGLDAAAKERYAAINKELSKLYTDFANNILADEENYVTYITKDQLSGLPESFVKAAAKAAADRGKEGMYAVTNTRSSMDQFLTYSDERALREKVWNTYYSRGDNGNETDNNANIAQILKLRNERVKLLGHNNYAEWRLQNRMAKTPERAMDLMLAVWPAAIARVKEEVADMQKIADKGKTKIKIEPWDYRYYAEKVRKQKYDLNSDDVKQYLELNNLTQAMFFTAGELFNFNFKPVPEGSVPVFQEDVKVWEVTDKTTGKHIGLWYLDPFARQGKRSGAWASSSHHF